MDADPLGAAIAATDQPPPIEMAQLQLQLFTGRPAVLVVPKDISELELLNLIANVIAVGDQLRAQRPGSRIIVPR